MHLPRATAVTVGLLCACVWIAAGVSVQGQLSDFSLDLKRDSSSSSERHDTSESSEKSSSSFGSSEDDDDSSSSESSSWESFSSLSSVSSVPWEIDDHTSSSERSEVHVASSSSSSVKPVSTQEASKASSSSVSSLELKNTSSSESSRHDELPRSGPPTGAPGCFTANGLWTTNREQCAKQQREVLLKLPPPTVSEAPAAAAPPPIVREIATTVEQEEDPVIERQAITEIDRRFAHQGKTKEKRDKLKEALNEAAEKVEIIAATVSDEQARRYMQEVSTWYRSAAAIAEQETIDSAQIEEIARTAKTVSTDVTDVARQFGHASAPTDPSPIVIRISTTVERLQRAVAYVRSENIVVDPSVDLWAAKARAVVDHAGAMCIATRSDCDSLHEAVDLLATAASQLQETLIQAGRADLIDTLERMF